MKAVLTYYSALSFLSGKANTGSKFPSPWWSHQTTRDDLLGQLRNVQVVPQRRGVVVSEAAKPRSWSAAYTGGRVIGQDAQWVPAEHNRASPLAQLRFSITVQSPRAWRLPYIEQAVNDLSACYMKAACFPTQEPAQNSVHYLCSPECRGGSIWKSSCGKGHLKPGHSGKRHTDVALLS